MRWSSANGCVTSFFAASPPGTTIGGATRSSESGNASKYAVMSVSSEGLDFATLLSTTTTTRCRRPGSRRLTASTNVRLSGLHDARVKSVGNSKGTAKP